jgi:hypothetical protein
VPFPIVLFQGLRNVHALSGSGLGIHEEGVRKVARL